MSTHFEAPAIVEQPPHQTPEFTEPSRIQEISNAGKRLILRGALALGLASGLVVVESAVVEPRPAMANTGGYPHADAPCEPSSTVRDANGNYLRCNNYNWYVDENGNGAYNSGELNSPRGYGYRNCTDWVAWRVRNAGVGSVPGGWVMAAIGTTQLQRIK